MSDPRVKDAVFEVRGMLASLAKDIQLIREDNKYLKEQIRAIKKSIVRKYDKKDDQIVSEEIDVDTDTSSEENAKS